jgi:hypothetical protein
MPRSQVVDHDMLYTVSPLEAPNAGDRDCAIFTANLNDETTGRPPRAAVSVALTAPQAAGLAARVVEPGLLVISGKLRRAFSPTLAVTGTLALELRAASFLQRDLTVEFACRQRLLALAGSGSIITLDSTLNLLAGQRLLISTADGARVEFATIQSLGPGVNQLTLAQNLDSPYPLASTVQPLPPDLSVDFHRAPTLISGRVLKRVGAIVSPLALATVRISKLWRQVPAAGLTVPPDPPVPGPSPVPPWAPPIAAIRPPCYADMPSGSAVAIEDRPIDAVMSPKTLLDAVPAGATTLRLSDALGLALNNVLAIDADDDGRREIIEASGITLSGGPGDWVSVALSQPLAFSHARARIVRRLGAPAGGAPVALNYAALRGDGAVLLDTTGIAGTHQVRITDPGPPIRHSYHRLDILAATTDANGFYRLPALTRAGKVEVAAQDTSSPAKTALEFVPDYTLSENPLDLIVS